MPPISNDADYTLVSGICQLTNCEFLGLTIGIRLNSIKSLEILSGRGYNPHRNKSLEENMKKAISDALGKR